MLEIMKNFKSFLKEQEAHVNKDIYEKYVKYFIPMLHKIFNSL